MVVTTASAVLRVATDAHLVSIVLIASMALVVLITPFIRPCLRERWNDGQSEDDRSNEDGLAKNVASRRVCEL